MCENGVKCRVLGRFRGCDARGGTCILYFTKFKTHAQGKYERSKHVCPHACPPTNATKKTTPTRMPTYVHDHNRKQRHIAPVTTRFHATCEFAGTPRMHTSTTTPSKATKQTKKRTKQRAHLHRRDPHQTTVEAPWRDIQYPVVHRASCVKTHAHNACHNRKRSDVLKMRERDNQQPNA